MAELGFIGLGKMGSPMTARLLDAGHTVHVHDTHPQAVAVAVQRGATAQPSARAVADAADILFASLPTPAILQLVMAEIAGGGRVQIAVDLSTTGPRIAAEVARAFAATRIGYVDCPVSGGVPGAERGTLALMAACPDPLYDQVAPILAAFGTLFHVGTEPGQGQTLKLANNLLSAAALAATAEAMVMGAKAGLDPKLMLDVINVSTGRNSATLDKFPRAVLPRSFDVGFTAGLLLKDVRLCLDEAEAMGVPTIVGSAVRQMLALTNSVYGPGADCTDLVKLVEGWAGVEIGRPTPAG